MKASFILAGFIIFAATFDAAAQPQGIAPPSEKKRAWEYSDDERLAQRFDPVSIRERAAADQTARQGGRPLGTAGAGTEESRELPNVIVGRRNPELFMPYELFMQLLQSGVVEDRAGEYRARREKAIATITAPADFWTHVEAASAPYTRLLSEEKVLLSGLAAANDSDRRAMLAQIAVLQEPQCAARADALEAAAKAIGRTALYRVLYEVVALNVAINAAPSMTIDQMRFLAGGCQ